MDFVQLHYAEAPGPGPALLFAHGTTGSHTSFLPFLPALAKYAHVYALDLRGHGLSGRVPDAYRLPDYGRDVAAFLQTVVDQPTTVAGHSSGGLLATWLAVNVADCVTGIFLEDPPLFLTQFPRFQGTGFYHYFVHVREHLTEHQAKDGTLDEMVAYVSQAPINDKGQTLLDLGGPEMVQERALQLHQLDPDTLDPIVDDVYLGPEDPDDLLARVRSPVRLLAGEREAGGALNAPDLARAVAELDQCEVTVFAGTGHMIHQERAAEYEQALIKFVSA